MKIEDLSYITEVTENNNANNVNGGSIDYEELALRNASWMEFAGDSIEVLGVDGSPLYGAAEDWIESIYI
jgi:hypothetical protein